jgi:hypothetical protein
MHRYHSALTQVATVTVAIACLGSAIFAADLFSEGRIEFQGSIDGPTDISGLAQVNGFLAIVSDEGIALDLLKKVDDGHFRLSQSIPLLKRDEDEKPEIDMEGTASDGNLLYVVGSHSLTRKRVDSERDYETNRKRLAKISPEDDRSDRDKLFQLTIQPDGSLGGKQKINLRNLLREDAILSPFCDIPSKENGLDIEGIAIQKHRLFVGFRGPVLRGNFVPVMVFKFDKPDDYELRFIDLDGRGIRDITAAREGFLVIGGPVGDGDSSYRLYFWNGEDSIPGAGSPLGKVVSLGEIPAPHGAKAEGVTLLDETEQSWRVLVVYDGPINGEPTVFKAPKPAAKP